MRHTGLVAVGSGPGLGLMEIQAGTLETLRQGPAVVSQASGAKKGQSWSQQGRDPADVQDVQAQRQVQTRGHGVSHARWTCELQQGGQDPADVQAQRTVQTRGHGVQTRPRRANLCSLRCE